MINDKNKLLDKKPNPPSPVRINIPPSNIAEPFKIFILFTVFPYFPMVIAPTKASNPTILIKIPNKLSRMSISFANKTTKLSNKNMKKNTVALNSIKSVKAFLDQIKTKPSRKSFQNPLTKASLYRKT